MNSKIIRGKKGENIAAGFLEKQGMVILERNWRYSRVGEIDIIAKEGDTLVFIEVKARSTIDFGHPVEAISPAKLNTIHQLAEIYANSKACEGYKDFRIDIIGVLINKIPKITHLKDVSL